MKSMRVRGLVIPVWVTRQMRGYLELVLVLSILSVLASVAMRDYLLYVERAHVAEVLVAATAIQQELTAMRAERGRWPADGAPWIFKKNAEGNARSSIKVYYEEAAFTIVMQRGDKAHRISFRAATHPSSPRAPVFWLCGFSVAPAGYRVVAPNQTDIPVLYLPRACRGEVI